MDKKEAIEIVKKLKEECIKSSECRKCVFYKDDIKDCVFSTLWHSRSYSLNDLDYLDD